MTTMNENMVLRTIYLSREIDRKLKTIAFARDISKGELIRNFIIEALPRFEGQSLASQIDALASKRAAKAAKPIARPAAAKAAAVAAPKAAKAAAAPKSSAAAAARAGARAKKARAEDLVEDLVAAE